MHIAIAARRFLGTPGLRRAVRGLVLVLLAAAALPSGPRSVAHVSAAGVTASRPERAAMVPPSADTTAVLDWRTMAGLDYRSGRVTPELRQLDGTEVRIPGFIVPLEDTATQVTEFLLVPYVGACVHVPPPPPNQLVYVTMTEGTKAKVDWWNPVWIHGRVRIATTESVYGAVGYQLDGVRITPYEY